MPDRMACPDRWMFHPDPFYGGRSCGGSAYVVLIYTYFWVSGSPLSRQG